MSTSYLLDPTGHILLAEDSPTQAQRLQYILEQKGYRVAVTANGKLALESARQQRPTLIVSDVVMPEMDGYELCRSIKADPDLSDVPVILVTTLSDPQDVVRGLECRADHFILKPYDEIQLLGRIHFVLLNRHMRHEEQPGMGLEIYFNGARHFITADRLQILNLLLSTYEAAIQRNKELTSTRDMLRETNSELQELTRELEDRVLHRTQELETSNNELRSSQHQLQESAESLQTQVDRRDLLNGITRAIGERQDLRSIFRVVILRLEDHLPIDFGCICLHDPATHLSTVCSIGAKNRALGTALSMATPTAVSLDEHILARCSSGQLVYEPDVSHAATPFLQLFARNGLNCVVVAPLIVDGELFGAVSVARREANSFSEDEREFLVQLSEHVALAARQTQLYEDLQRAYDDLRRTQQAVMQQERLRVLGQMASGVAHDVNNAISPIALYTETLLENEAGLSAQGRRYLATIQRAIDDVAQTVARMREFYRRRDEEEPLGEVDLNMLVHQVVELTQARWSDQSQRRGVMIELKTDLDPALPRLQGAGSEIRDALTNLIFNAVDALPDGGRIVVRTATGAPANGASTPDVHLEVIDNGVGMDEQTRRRCLEPFFTTKGERGTGLGLAMAYGMAQRHGADIEIDSKIGVGTTVRVIFPAKDATNTLTEQTIRGLRPPRPLRILIVDDDDLVLESLFATLQSDGHDVAEAQGGQAGIDAFLAAQRDGKPFDVVMTDLGMPYVDGRKVATTVRAAAPNVSIILLTGWGKRMETESDRLPPVDHLLSKPPRLAELRHALALCCTTERPERPASGAASSGGTTT